MAFHNSLWGTIKVVVLHVSSNKLTFKLNRKWVFSKSTLLKNLWTDHIQNHLIWLWVVFIWDKPLTRLLSGQIPLESHWTGNVVGGHGGLEIYLIFLKILAQNASRQGWKFLFPPSQTTWVVFANGHCRVTALQGIT
jgi:hypothetical protein